MSKEGGWERDGHVITDIFYALICIKIYDY